jgi:hypothetical protein
MTGTSAYLTSYSDAYGAASRTDIYGSSYDGTYGVAFPAAPLDARAELDLNGTWTDITSDVYQRDTGSGITISRGRADELTGGTAGTLALELNNRTGNYSPRNPLGAYYGIFGRNTPVRVSVPALEPSLRCENDALSGAACPDSAALDITGAIDIRIDARLSSYMPCILASKWTAATGSVTLAGTTVGSTCNQACYPGSASQLAAGQKMDTIVGRPVALTAQKVYFSSGSTPTFPSSVLAKDQGLLNARCLLWLCYKPAPDGSDSAALTTSVSAYVAAAAAAGAPVPKVVLWQEPQDSLNVSLGLTDAATYKTCMKNYYSAIKALAGSPAVVYDSASHAGETAVREWYPGDAYCDEVAQDLYGYTWKHGGVTLATLESIANAASPQKPVSLAEYGTALNQTQANLMTHQDVAAFFAYIQGVFTARSAAGLPNSEVMWFNGLQGADWNTIEPGDFRIPLMDALYDALQPSSGGKSSAGRSWALCLNASGTLSLYYTSDGTLGTLTTVTSSVPVPLGRVTLRAYAASGSSVTFWSAPGGNASAIGTGAPWAQLGSTRSPGALSIVTGTAPLQAGYNAEVAADFTQYPGGLTGAVFGLQVRDFSGAYSDTYSDLYGAPSGGAAAADAGFTSQPPGTSTWTDSLGNPWEVTGTAEISQRSYRCHMEMSSVPVQWDPAGRDVSAPVQAGGLLRRMSQGQQPPVSSAFKRAILGLTGANAPVAYWPCEDTGTAAQLGPAIGAAPLTFNRAPALAADSSFTCSLPIPAMPSGTNGTWKGSIAPYSGGTAAVFRFLMHVPSSPSISNNSLLARFNTTGTAGIVTLRWDTGGALQFSGYGGGAFQWDTGADATFAVDGELALVSMELQPSGQNLSWQLAVLTVGSSTPLTVSGTVSGGQVGNVTRVVLGDDQSSPGGTAFGHAFLQTSYEPLTGFTQALQAWAGETCAARFARLCSENGIASRIYGPPGLDVAMGAQAPDTLLNLLQLCETTGRGQMYEPRQALALGYRTVRSMCAQAPAVTADYSAAEIGDGTSALIPVDDDQHTVNDVTVTSGTGSTYQAVQASGPMSTAAPPAGVGDYGNSYTVNTAADTQLPDEAGWILNTGTVADERYPTVPFHLGRTAAQDILYPAQEADIGDYLQIVNTPAFLPPGPVKQLIYGTSEVLGGTQYKITFNTVPEAPYETGIYADPVYGRMDTDGSQLDADIGTADTTFTADITGPSGITWTTVAAQFPFGIMMGGEQMTVTAITGPPVNFLTGDNTGFEGGTGNWAAVTNCTIAQTTAAAHSGTGSLLITASAAASMTAASCTAGNILTQGLPVSPSDTVTLTAWFRAQASVQQCQCGIDWYDGTGTYLSSSAGGSADDTLTGWTEMSLTASAPASAAFARATLNVFGALGVGAVSHYADDVFFGNVTAGGIPQQQFTVVRSVNGIVKAHSAGEALSLAHPAIIALA